MMSVGEEYITCYRCNTKFEKDRIYTSCSNCFVCTGCEIYYCPTCDEEIVITPVKKIGKPQNSEPGNDI